MPEDYTTVTELPESGATREQLARLYHRYHVAKQYAADKRVLEVACGAGLGLGYLAKTAATVVGGDYTDGLLHTAQSYYQGRVPLLRMDAHFLPFRSQSFDLVFVFEAIYYFADAKRFIAEARRLLNTNGTLLIGTVNKDWSEFAPSPFSTRYFSVPELRDLLRQEGYASPEFYGAFPTNVDSPKHKIVSLVRRLVVALNLMPKTLEGRARFKRLFYGSLTPLPSEVTDGMTELEPSVSISGDTPNTDYKIVYVVARAG
jgi:SAM-dependent methyltransferase